MIIVFLLLVSVMIMYPSFVFQAYASEETAGEPVRIYFNGGINSYLIFSSQNKEFLENSLIEEDPDTGELIYSPLEYNDFDIKKDISLSFSGEGVLDNGMTVYAWWENSSDWNIETEGALDDEGLALSTALESGNFWRISPTGWFGQVRIGGSASASDALRVGEAVVGGGALGDAVAANDYADLVIEPEGYDAGLRSFPDLTDGDSQNIGYYSPGKYPFRIGISYSPWVERGIWGDSVQNSAGIRYGPTFGDLTIRGSVGYSRLYASRDYKVANNWLFGGSLSYKAVTLNGIYRKEERPYTAEAIAENPDMKKDDNVRTWQCGVAYEGKPHTFQLQYRGGQWRGWSIEDGDEFLQSVEIIYKNTVSPSSRIEGGISYTMLSSKYQDGDKERVGGAWGAGLSYSTPPYIVQVQYQTSHRINDDEEEGRDSFWRIGLSGRYIIGPDVRLEGAVFYANKRNGIPPSVSSEERAVSWNAGLTVAAGMRVSF